MTSIPKGALVCALALLAAAACSVSTTSPSPIFDDDAGSGPGGDSGTPGQDASRPPSSDDASVADTGPGTDSAPPPKPDAGPPPTDVGGSAECTAYCAKAQNDCNATCIPKSDCAIPAGQCAASTKAFLACETQTGQWYCGTDGFSIVSDCQQDTSLCK